MPTACGFFAEVTLAVACDSTSFTAGPELGKDVQLVNAVVDMMKKVAAALIFTFYPLEPVANMHEPAALARPVAPTNLKQVVLADELLRPRNILQMHE